MTTQNRESLWEKWEEVTSSRKFYELLIGWNFTRWRHFLSFFSQTLTVLSCECTKSRIIYGRSRFFIHSDTPDSFCSHRLQITRFFNTWNADILQWRHWYHFSCKSPSCMMEVTIDWAFDFLFCHGRNCIKIIILLHQQLIDMGKAKRGAFKYDSNPWGY